MKQVYMATRNGSDIGVAFAPRTEGTQVLVSTSNRTYDFDTASYSLKEVDSGMNLVPSDPEAPVYSLRELTLDDAKTIFPHSIRTYNSVEDFTEFVHKKLKEETSYAVQESSDVTYSFTIDEDDSVLELIYTDAEGDMYVRDLGDWDIVAEDDDAPTIFDKTMIDVLTEDQEKAVAFWDKASTDLDGIKKDAILQFAALEQ